MTTGSDRDHKAERVVLFYTLSFHPLFGQGPIISRDVDVDLRVLFVNVLYLEWEVTNAQFLFVLEQVEELYSLDLDSLGQLRSDLSLALTSFG
jgi:hypothetical protein